MRCLHEAIVAAIDRGDHRVGYNVNYLLTVASAPRAYRYLLVVYVVPLTRGLEPGSLNPAGLLKTYGPTILPVLQRLGVAAYYGCPM